MDTIQIQSDNKEAIRNPYVKVLDKSQLEQAICFIDKFFVPKNAIETFTQRMNYNRNFIKNLSGFIKDDVYEQKDGEGNLTIITIAVWQSQEDLYNAKNAVQAEYKRIDFNPDEFLKRLNITMERGLYTFYQEQ